MFGYILNTALMDALGRRITFGIGLLPCLVGVLLTFYATNITTLICGRFLVGVSAGTTGTLGPIVIGEYCSPQYRGIFLNMKTAGLYLGSLVGHIVGYYIHWKTVALLCGTPYAIALVITYTWPESPSWYVRKRRFRESEETFYHLRGTSELAIREIKELIRAQKSTTTNERTFLEKIVNLAKIFTKRNVLKPALIFVFAAILLETSGRHVFPTFAAQIIIRITDNDSQTFYYTLAVDILITVSVLFSAYLIKVVKLRKLLFSTGLISCTVLSLACLHLFLVAKEVVPKGYTAIPITLFGLYFLFANLGCAPVPLALMGEIFPLEHRAVGTSVAGFLIAVFYTIALKIMPIMLHTIDIYGAFAVLALSMGISLFILYFILPETKDKTLLEIEEFFNNGKVKDRNTVVCEEEDVKKMISKEGIGG